MHIYHYRIMIRIAVQTLVLHLVRAMLVIPIGIDVPRTHTHDLRRHRLVGKTAIEIPQLASETIRVIILLTERQHVCITCTNERLDRLFCGIAVVVAQQQQVRIAKMFQCLRQHDEQTVGVLHSAHICVVITAPRAFGFGVVKADDQSFSRRNLLKTLCEHTRVISRKPAVLM